MEISMTEQELKTRRAPQTFNVRLDLLHQLSERTPKGQWSRWLEEILIRELQGNSYRQGKIWADHQTKNPDAATFHGNGNRDSFNNKRQPLAGWGLGWVRHPLPTITAFFQLLKSCVDLGSTSDITPPAKTVQWLLSHRIEKEPLCPIIQVLHRSKYRLGLKIPRIQKTH